MKQINAHLVKGFSVTLPVIILFSISLALDQNIRDLGRIPDTIFLFVIPVLTMTIANSITPKILLIPGAILGYYMNELGIGFFGGILGGLLLGYIGLLLTSRNKIQSSILLVLVSYIGIGFVSLALSYLVMEYIVSSPILWMMNGISNWIAAIDPTQTVLLVGILALFTVVDLGGPFNKVAFTFVLQFYTQGLYHITGPAIISVAIPPLSMLAVLYIYPKRFTKPPTTTIRLLTVGGIFGLTESAIPVILEDPLRRHVPVIVGSVAASTLAASMGLSNVLMMVSLPGMFGASNIGVYVLAHVVGIGIIVVLIGLFSRQKKELHPSEIQV